MLARCGGKRLMLPVCVEDYRALARERLPPFLFEYIDGGSYGEVTLRRNREDLEAIQLRQQVLRDVSSLDLATTLFGQSLSMPLVLGPIGLAGINARRGECQDVQAADRAGIPFCLSTVSVCALSEVKSSAMHSFWFQLYMVRDRAFMVDLLAQAETAGCSALVFTVDMPVPGARYRDYRSGLAGAPGLRGQLRRVGQALMHPRWAWDVGVCGRPHALGNVVPVLGYRSGLEDFFAWMRGNFDPSVTWEDIAWVRSRWKGPLILKGILDPHDAREAVRSQVDAIVVSNHGGRQLDGVLSSAKAFPAIVDAIGTQLPVLVDGGVRSGLDVMRFLALGARAVLLGRAWAYALAARGGVGVSHMLDLMASEMRVAMSLTGCTTIAGIGRDALATADGRDS
jgi:L-lactate dehydrogenase (cytochrome)